MWTVLPGAGCNCPLLGTYVKVMWFVKIILCWGPSYCFSTTHYHFSWHLYKYDKQQQEALLYFSLHRLKNHLSFDETGWVPPARKLIFLIAVIIRILHSLLCPDL